MNVNVIDSLVLCSKGVSIPKEILSTEQEENIKKELQAKPFSPPNSIQKKVEFSIYRESKKKLYVPRFYALNWLNNHPDKTIHVKNIETSTLQESVKIDIDFKGDLRPYQENIVDTYVKEAERSGCGLLEIPCGRGKTVMALNIISQLKKKTIVIVHKEFLLNQWVERIQQFLPDATIGRIQGQTIDIEGKDIVLGMLQSLSMKEYDSSIFKGFGLTIVDECHHISAEVFSRSLFKIVTENMLGLSATMDRKDNMTSVFKLFLGNVVYKEKRQGDDKVNVRALHYNVEDEDYSQVVYNFKGQTHYSIMIKKLCEFNPRTEFILKVLKDLLNEDGNENQHIMILAHNKSVLKYLHDAIEHRNIASVGYYVGGMKEKDLKISESKKVIIATYAMAEEALDIKTLSTLILATPKTDVTQAVGRILRIKHDKPIVLDIVDQHAVFQNQWTKRRRFYSKCNYKIQEIDSLEYHKNFEKWNIIYSPDTGRSRNRIKKPSLLNANRCLIKIDTKGL